MVQIVALYILSLIFIGMFPFKLPGGPIVAFKNIFGGGLDFWGITLYGFQSLELKLAASFFLLLLLVPKVNSLIIRIISRIYSLAVRFRISKNKIVTFLAIYVILPAAFLAAFYYAPNKSLGATGVFEDMLGRNLLFVGSNPLSTYVNYVLFSAAKQTTSGFFYDLASKPHLFIRAVSNLSGFFYILFLAHMSNNLFLETRKKIIFFAFLAFQGYLFLFFYDHDTHPHQVAFLILFLYYAIRYIRGQSNIIFCAFFLSISALMHMMSFVFLPSLFLLPTLRRELQASAGDCKEQQPFLFRALDTIFTWDTLIMTLTLILPVLILWQFLVMPNQDKFYGGAYGDLLGGGDGRMFLPLFNVETAYEAYTMLSWDNAAEKVNMLLFLCPMTLILAPLFSIKYWREIIGDPVSRFLLINFVFGALFIFMWCADYGVRLDWNLFSPAALLMSALVAYILAEKIKEEYYPYISLVAIFYSIMHLLTLLS